MPMTGPVEWLVGLVLGVDALVIAGLVVSRLTGRSRRRNAADEVPVDRLQAYAAYAAPASSAATAVAEPPLTTGAPMPDGEPVDATATESAYEQLADVPADGREASAGYDATSDVDPAAMAEPVPAPAEAAGAVTSDATPVDDARATVADEPAVERPAAVQPAAAATDWDAAVAETPAIPDRRSRPMGLDFGPTWVDPVAMAADAAAEWRRGLRRDLALASWTGRPGLVMNLKLDIETGPELPIADVARFEGQLHQTIHRLVRATDHFDRTGPGRFHVILSEMPEAAALAVAQRIRHGFAEAAGAAAPRLLIGWAAMETEADVAVALQRAAERLDGLGAAEGPITE
jgi:hypothetical protein